MGIVDSIEQQEGADFYTENHCIFMA
jgi:hypothetical protein